MKELVLLHDPLQPAKSFPLTRAQQLARQATMKELVQLERIMQQPSTARMFNAASKKLATKPIIVAASAEESAEEDKYPGEDILNAIYGAATLPGVIGKGAVDAVSEAVGVSET